MSSAYGDKIKISVFGESHGGGIGVVIDGLPAGEKIDLDAVLVQMGCSATPSQALRSAPLLKTPTHARRTTATCFLYRVPHTATTRRM